MDKFLCIFELAHGSMLIGAAKFVFSLVKSYMTFQAILSLTNRHGARFSNFEDTIIIEEATTGKYMALTALLVFYVVFAVTSALLVQASRKRHRTKVLSFLIADTIFTILLISYMIKLYFTAATKNTRTPYDAVIRNNIYNEAIWNTVYSAIQCYLYFVVYSFWKQLRNSNAVPTYGV